MAWREIAGETIVVDLGARKMYGLNPPAGAVWTAIVAGEEVEQVFPDFVADLLDRGLVVGEQSSTAGGHLASVPDTGSVPPLVTWEEELRSFGQIECGLVGGQGGPCNLVPAS